MGALDAPRGAGRSAPATVEHRAGVVARPVAPVIPGGTGNAPASRRGGAPLRVGERGYRGSTPRPSTLPLAGHLPAFGRLELAVFATLLVAATPGLIWVAMHAGEILRGLLLLVFLLLAIAAASRALYLFSRVEVRRGGDCGGC